VKEQRCRVCGCTDQRACPGSCYWVRSNLCNKCAVPTPSGWKAKPTRRFMVFECKTPMARFPGRFHSSHFAMWVDNHGLPNEPEPTHAHRLLGLFESPSKTEAILRAKEHDRTEGPS